MQNIKELKVVWHNPDEFTTYFKTNDNGSGVIDGTFSGEDNIELIPSYDNSSKQAEEFYVFLKDFDGVYKDFFDKNAHSVKYCKYNIYRLVIVYEENKEIKKQDFGMEFYNENFAEWLIQMQKDDCPEHWLDDEDTQKYIDIEYRLDSINVKNY